jgi:hypothetical protein
LEVNLAWERPRCCTDRAGSSRIPWNSCSKTAWNSCPLW